MCNIWPYDEPHQTRKPLAQAPTHETNTELWLKRHKYLWICRLSTFNKLSNKGLNKWIYDLIFHTNTDV